jgi:hypothetical protein
VVGIPDPLLGDPGFEFGILTARLYKINFETASNHPFLSDAVERSATISSRQKQM